MTLKPSPRWLSLTFLLLAGCGVVETAVDLPAQTVRAVTPGKKEGPSVDRADLQETMVRVADNLMKNAARGIDGLHRPGKPEDPAEILRWKIAIGGEIVSIATGANSLANLLDLTVFVTLTRGVIESHWKPDIYGDSAEPVLEAFLDSEAKLWKVIEVVLTPDQRKEFHEAIEAWKKENPDSENSLGARALGFSAQAGAKANSKPDSMFNLLRLDPLSGLDPATHEIAETRAFAERALYVSQKFPTLLRWQTELLALDAMNIPAVRQVVASSAQIAASADRIAVTAEKIPDRFSKEREEIVKVLREQEKEVASVLTAGTQMSASLNTTLGTFDGVMKRLGVGEPKPPGPEAPPVRIQDVTQAIAQLDATTKHLTELLQTLDHTLATADLAKLSSQVTPLVQRAETGGKEVVDYAFWKGCVLIGLVLLAALIYRFLGPRLGRPPAQ